MARRWWAVAFAVVAAIGALACNGEAGTSGSSGLDPGGPPPPKTPVAGLPASMAALGDSITVAFGTCLSPGDCPRNSWSTGSGTLVDSHYKRILGGNPAIKGHAKNYAVSGATAADLTAQAQQAAAGHPDYLTIMIGANDACRSTMTATSTFATEIGDALHAVKAGSRRTRILMVSIPDVYRVWEVGHTSRLARSVWSLGKVCPALLANPTSTASADATRRQAFRDRVDAYDRLLANACSGYGHLCRWDGGLVHSANFTLNDLSALDFFHPNTEGQNKISQLTYPGTFTW